MKDERASLEDVSLDGARAFLHGGWVTRERLEASAARSGRGAAPLLSELLKDQSPPSFANLAEACQQALVPLRLDSAHVVLNPRAARLLDRELLRRERCVPVELFDDVCVLAVLEGHAERAVQSVRAALSRDVVPVLADAAAIDRALDTLATPRRAVRRGPLRRKDSPIHARFRELVIEQDVLEPIRKDAAR